MKSRYLPTMRKTIYFCITFIMFNAILDARTQGDYINFNQKLVSNEDAKRNCITDSGRLLRYDKIIRTDSSAVIEDLLDNGQSVWVDGHASFAPPVDVRGCYEYKRRYYYPPDVLDNNGLYLCALHCLNDLIYTHFKTDYIGLTDSGCYCLTENDVNRKMRPVSESLCNYKCNQAYIDSCGGHGKISVYRLYTDQSINWAKNGPFHEQCMFVKLKEKGDRIEVFTASCYTISERVIDNWYFCKNGEYSQLSRDCSVRVTTKRYCVVNSSSTWEEARQVCLKYNGLLADLKSVELLRPLMANNTGYWTGVYRPFIATDKRRDLKTVCLAVTKHDNKLHLEPGNCLKENAYLCENPFMPSIIRKKAISSSYGTKTSPTLETISAERKDRESRETTQENSGDNYSTLREANVTNSKYSTIKENMTAVTVGLLEPPGQSKSKINPFAVGTVAFVAAIAVIAVGIVTWIVKRRCHKKSHECQKQLHFSMTPPIIPGTSDAGNNEPESYSVTGEEAVFSVPLQRACTTPPAS